MGGDLPDGRDQAGGVGGAVVAQRGRQAQEHELGAGHRRGGPEREGEAPAAEAVPHDLAQAVLDDGDLTPAEPGDLRLHHVGADDLVPEV